MWMRWTNAPARVCERWDGVPVVVVVGDEPDRWRAWTLCIFFLAVPYHASMACIVAGKI